MTREEAISLLSQVNHILVNSNSWLENTHEPLNIAFDMAIKALEQEPKTGHWIDDMGLGYHVSICSNCNWRGHGDTCLIYKPKYCPNCGADMREEER